MQEFMAGQVTKSIGRKNIHEFDNQFVITCTTPLGDLEGVGCEDPEESTEVDMLKLIVSAS